MKSKGPWGLVYGYTLFPIYYIKDVLYLRWNEWHLEAHFATLITVLQS